MADNRENENIGGNQNGQELGANRPGGAEQPEGGAEQMGEVRNLGNRARLEQPQRQRPGDFNPTGQEGGVYSLDDFAVPNASTASGAEYPYYDGFVKPVVKIGTCAQTYTHLHVLDHIANAAVISKPFILHFVWNQMEGLIGREKSGWISYGIEIAAANTDVTAQRLVHRETGEALAVPAERAHSDTSVTEAAVLGLCLAIIRVASITQEEHMERILNKMAQDYGTLGIQDVKQILRRTRWHTLLESHDFRLLASAIDMFLYRFPAASGSYMRMGTVVTRGAQLTALSSLSLLCPTKEDVYVFASWCGTRSLKTELIKMLKRDQEMDEPGSYFHYQIYMGLVSRSCYSAAENPHLTIFLHTAGCMLAAERSMKAFFPKSVQNFYEDVRLGIAFAYERSLIGQFEDEGGVRFRGVDYEEQNASDAGGQAYQARGCRYWIKCIKNGNEEWQTALSWARSVTLTWENPFDGTFAQRLYQIVGNMYNAINAAQRQGDLSLADFDEEQ